MNLFEYPVFNHRLFLMTNRLIKDHLPGILAGVLLLFQYSLVYGQHSDANVFGDVQSEGEHIPFATVYIEGTTIGTTTDNTGHYMLIDLPPGTLTVVATSMGYNTVKREITVTSDKVLEVNFELEGWIYI